MEKRVAFVSVLFSVLILLSGCGEKADEQKRSLELRGQHEKALAELRADREEERERYDEKIRSYEAELAVLRERLDAEKRRAGELEGKLESHLRVTREEKERGRIEVPAAVVAEPYPPMETVSLSRSAPAQIADALEAFAADYETLIDEGMRENFREDFGTFVAGLKEQTDEETTLQIKEKMLDGLRERIEGETDEDEIELLENRMEKIETAGDDDLPAILEYYGRLDSIQDLNKLMEKYNISGEELRASGITPPPRSRWGPDPKEIAYNLKNFVEIYEPLVDEGLREEYGREFDEYLSGLTTKLSEEKALQERNRYLSELEEQIQTATGRERRRIERRMRRMENSDAADFQRRFQFERLREMGRLTEKYEIPESELRRMGAGTPRWGRRRN